jgi:glycosyltransferase involved in cell wall biosynthesis
MRGDSSQRSNLGGIVDGFRIWYILAGVIGAIWLFRHWAISYALRRRRVLHSGDYDPLGSDAPKISVLVAAKDEEANIEACIRSLLDQDYPDYEIIAINDRSTDATLPILRGLEKEAGGRLTVIDVDHLPEGWFGKNNAMHQGMSSATGEYFCFVDADCRQTSRRSLSTAMAHALHYNTDFLSIFPRLEAPTVWERVLQPVCAGLLFTWFPANKVNKRHRKTAYANGQFMLLRRSCYETIGGHERVRTQVNEDMHFARLVKMHGLRLRVVENEDLYVARMYRAPRELWRGWSRIFYGSIGSVWKLLLSMASILLLTLLPWVSLIVAVFAAACSPTGQAGEWVKAIGAWAIVVALMQLAAVRLYRIFRVGAVWSLGYPLAALTTLGILFSALLKVLGLTATTWRGTTYMGDQVVQQASTGKAMPKADSAAPEKTS